VRSGQCAALLNLLEKKRDNVRDDRLKFDGVFFLGRDQDSTNRSDQKIAERMAVVIFPVEKFNCVCQCCDTELKHLFFVL
jgi:hypothetical protein